MANWKSVKQSEEKKTPKKEKKQHMGSKKRKLWAILPIALVVALAAGAVIWALPQLPVTPNAQGGAEYSGVIELWNVEGFEGGAGSREGWLKSCAAKLEQANKGLFVHVTTLSGEQLASKLQAGDKFDMICFSRGAGAAVKSLLAALDLDPVGVRDNMLVSGQVNGAQYALPVYAGVYCLFAREQMLAQEQLLELALTRTYTRKVGKNDVTLSPIIAGFTPYNSPLSALAMSGGRGKAALSEEVTQYAAYESFVANRTAVTLLGTQRDMYRLSQREQNGRIEQLAFAPLAGYTDLVQYVGVAQGERLPECTRFAQYLVGEQAQAALTSLGMFSVLEQSFYTQDRYAECEAGLAHAYVPNAFGDGEAVARQRRAALDTLAV